MWAALTLTACSGPDVITIDLSSAATQLEWVSIIGDSGTPLLPTQVGSAVTLDGSELGEPQTLVGWAPGTLGNRVASIPSSRLAPLLPAGPNDPRLPKPNYQASLVERDGRWIPETEQPPTDWTASWVVPCTHGTAPDGTCLECPTVNWDIVPLDLGDDVASWQDRFAVMTSRGVVIGSSRENVTRLMTYRGGIVATSTLAGSYQAAFVDRDDRLWMAGDSGSFARITGEELELLPGIPGGALVASSLQLVGGYVGEELELYTAQGSPEVYRFWRGAWEHIASVAGQPTIRRQIVWLGPRKLIMVARKSAAVVHWNDGVETIETIVDSGIPGDNIDALVEAPGVGAFVGFSKGSIRLFAHDQWSNVGTLGDLGPVATFPGGLILSSRPRMVGLWTPALGICDARPVFPFELQRALTPLEDQYLVLGRTEMEPGSLQAWLLTP